MADCALSPSCSQLYLRRNCGGRISSAANVLVLRRKHCHVQNNVAVNYASWRVNAAATGRNFKGYILTGSSKKRASFRCHYFGLNPENISILKSFPIVDQVLLMTSVVLAYMAGVVPLGRVATHDRKNTRGIDSGSSEFPIPGSSSSVEKIIANTEDYWKEVEDKLLDSLDALNQDNNLFGVAGEWQKYNTRLPQSLFAITVGSRLRLLHVTLQQLQKETANIAHIIEVDNRDSRLIVSSEIIQGSLQPTCLRWLEGELSLQNKDPNKAVIGRIFQNLERGDSILQKIRRLEKEDLYADLLFYLRFGSQSPYYCYKNSFSTQVTQHAVDILEDLVITLADGISSIYLELISVDSAVGAQIDGLGLSICPLSTRALQKLRNEAALSQWLVQNFESVVSMYEDRFELFVLERKVYSNPSGETGWKFNWLKSNATQKTRQLTSYLHYAVIIQSTIYVRRTKDLRALRGWRYYYSLFLELSDVTMPFIKAAFVKAREAISFFLTCLIGRSLGLIYSGIRQSIGWR